MSNYDYKLYVLSASVGLFLFFVSVQCASQGSLYQAYLGSNILTQEFSGSIYGDSVVGEVHLSYSPEGTCRPLSNLVYTITNGTGFPKSARFWNYLDTDHCYVYQDGFWDMGASDWDTGSSYSKYCFDEEQRLIEEIHGFYVFGSSDSYTYEYDDMGRLVWFRKNYFSGYDYWFLHEYNSESRLSKVSTYRLSPDQTDTLLVAKDVYGYVDNELSKIRYFELNEETGDWEHTKFEDFAYDEFSNLKHRSMYKYNPVSEVYELYFQQNWEYDDYNEDHLVYYAIYRTDYDTQNFYLSEQFVYSYYTDTDIVETEKYSMALDSQAELVLVRDVVYEWPCLDLDETWMAAEGNLIQNPSSYPSFALDEEENTLLEIEVYDMLGNLVFSRVFRSFGVDRLDLRELIDLEIGVYVIVTEGNGDYLTYKWIKD